MEKIWSFYKHLQLSTACTNWVIHLFLLSAHILVNIKSSLPTHRDPSPRFRKNGRLCTLTWAFYQDNTVNTYQYQHTQSLLLLQLRLEPFPCWIISTFNHSTNTRPYIGSTTIEWPHCQRQCLYQNIAEGLYVQHGTRHSYLVQDYTSTWKLDYLQLWWP